jgi:hypothetical protein
MDFDSQNSENDSDDEGPKLRIKFTPKSAQPDFDRISQED